MRDLSTQEIGHVYGAGGNSRGCKPVKVKCKSGSRGKRSGSRCKGSKSRSRGRCGS